MDMIEQIARALYAADNHDREWPAHYPDVREYYYGRAEAVLPIFQATIAAETERCAMVCENHMADCLDDRDIQRRWPQIKARNAVYAAAIRSKPC